MPTVPCQIALRCPGGVPGSDLDVDSPITNLSAEGPDISGFMSTGFPVVIRHDPIGPTINGNNETTGGPYLYWALGCTSVCFSTVSQAAADACAAYQAYLCSDGGGPPNFPNPKPNPHPLFFNEIQGCTFPCPDGTAFGATVQAGEVAADSLELANLIAREIACQRAAANHICLDSFDSPVCVGSHYSSTVTASGGRTPIAFTKTNGDFPPGLSPSSGTDERSFKLSGTPTTAGTYVFTLKAVDAIGAIATKQFTIQVSNLAALTSVPKATLGIAYNYQIPAAAGTNFLLVSGALPNGLSLSVSGLISGTPNKPGVYNFTIQAIDLVGGACQGDGSIEVTACVDWTKMVWGAPNIFNPGFGAKAAASIDGSGISGNASGEGAAQAGAQTLIDQMVGTMLYTGGACVCFMVVNVTQLQQTQGGTGQTQVLGGVEVVQDGTPLAGVRINWGTIGVNNSVKFDDSGSVVFPAAPATVVLQFTVKAGINSVLQVKGAHNNQYYVLLFNGTGNDFGKLAFNFTLGN